MHEGIVTAIKLDKGYGFIGEVGAPDLFFHYSDLDGLQFDEQLQGQRVTFDIEQNARGPRARNVRAAD